MNDLQQIHTALNRLYNDDGQRIIFWNDPEQEFSSALTSITLDGVTVLRLDQVGSLEAKIRLERDDPGGKFLVYSPTEEPDFEDDWLLDLRLYSRSFRADRASILLQQLGLVNQHLRSHLALRRKFFDSKDRLQKLAALVAPDDAAPDLDRKMIAITARADQPELFNLVQTLFHTWTDGEIDLDTPPVGWAQIEKFDLDDSFWQMTKTSFGYESDNPTLKNLLFRMLLTDFAYHLQGDVPQAIRSLVLPRNGWPNTVVCLAQWRDSGSKGKSYDLLAAEAAAILKVDNLLADLELDQLVDVMTFLPVEQRIASILREQVETTSDTINAEDIKKVATRRQAGHWASLSVVGSPGIPRQALHAVYEAIVAAAEFHSLRNQYLGGFDYPDAGAMYAAYEQELYRFDQLYRHFCESADTAEQQGWSVVKPLRQGIEAHYVNWYLTNLALAWGDFVRPPGDGSVAGLLDKWRIASVPNQHAFYQRHVRPWIESGDNRRAFVIISDAFRYEAAQELTDQLNGKFRFEATLSSQLGVLPSYTALGMASLLPHKKLAYKGADVMVDGRSSAAAERDGILQSVGGMACKAKDLMELRQGEGRELVRDKRVVYIYHDVVDATGDVAKTEDETFRAVRRAINDLDALISFVVNGLNGNHVVLTADHGFLFSETARVESDKSKLEEKPTGALVAKKRYLVGTSLPKNESAWHGKTSVTAATDDETEFWIPKGTNLFHFVGGAKFVHGGAMPQEIVVPVVTIKQVRGKAAQETKTRAAAVHVLGTNHRVTTATHRFQLIQTEQVGGRIKPITLKVAIYDGEEPVSNVVSVTFDSSSENLEDRKKWVSLALKDRAYNKKTAYRLVLQDVETGMQQQSVEVMIDRAFSDDF